MSMDAARAEFWSDLQEDFFVSNSAYYLANQELAEVIGTRGSKAHKPIMSLPRTGTYTPHSDITFNQKNSTDQYLTVDTFKYAADSIDDTESFQSPYDMVAHSSKAIRRGLMNQVEQKFMDQIASSQFLIDDNGSPLLLDVPNILDVIGQADSSLGSFDAFSEFSTQMKAGVFGPHDVSLMRRYKADRESRLGDETFSNGVVGPWMGWTIVQNNNLPWGANLGLATAPTDGDTVKIAGVTFTFKTSLGSTAGNVLIGADAAAARANLRDAVLGLSGAGTTYVELSDKNINILREKRRVSCTSAATMVFTGYGDIVVSETLTDTTDGWSGQYQDSVLMVRGAIDLIVQMNSLDVIRKEKGFGDLVKGMVGVGAKAFDDGASMMVKVRKDASQWK